MSSSDTSRSASRMRAGSPPTSSAAPSGPTKAPPASPAALVPTSTGGTPAAGAATLHAAGFEAGLLPFNRLPPLAPRPPSVQRLASHVGEDGSSSRRSIRSDAALLDSADIPIPQTDEGASAANLPGAVQAVDGNPSPSCEEEEGTADDTEEVSVQGTADSEEGEDAHAQQSGAATPAATAHCEATREDGSADDVADGQDSHDGDKDSDKGSPEGVGSAVDEDAEQQRPSSSAAQHPGPADRLGVTAMPQGYVASSPEAGDGEDSDGGGSGDDSDNNADDTDIRTDVTGDNADGGGDGAEDGSDSGHESLEDSDDDGSSSEDEDWSPLHRAARKGQVEVVQALLQERVNIEEGDRSERTPLHHAAREGHLEVVKALMDGKADSNAKDSEKRTPLHLAALEGHVEVVKALLNGRTNTEAEDDEKRTPLHLAALEDRVEVVKALLKWNANTEAKDKETQTPLHHAATKGHVEVVEALLHGGADTEAEAEEKRTPLHLAALEDHVEVVKVLLKWNANTEAKDEETQTPLHHAATKGHVEVVEALLDGGADTEAEAEEKRTPLHLAALEDHMEVIKVLLKWNANTEAKDEDERTPLHLAALEDHVEVVKALLKWNANTEAKDEETQTPLHHAATKGHVEVVEALLDGGADTEAEAEEKRTPLHVAALEGHVEVVKVLLDENANIEAEDDGQRTPLHLAARKGHMEAVEALLQKGADAVAEDFEEGLHVAVRTNRSEVVKKLLEFSWDCVTCSMRSFDDEAGDQYFMGLVRLDVRHDNAPDGQQSTTPAGPSLLLIGLQHGSFEAAVILNFVAENVSYTVTDGAKQLSEWLAYQVSFEDVLEVTQKPWDLSMLRSLAKGIRKSIWDQSSSTAQGTNMWTDTSLLCFLCRALLAIEQQPIECTSLLREGLLASAKVYAYGSDNAPMPFELLLKDLVAKPIPLATFLMAIRTRRHDLKSSELFSTRKTPLVMHSVHARGRAFLPVAVCTPRDWPSRAEPPDDEEKTCSQLDSYLRGDTWQTLADVAGWVEVWTLSVFERFMRGFPKEPLEPPPPTGKASAANKQVVKTAMDTYRMAAQALLFLYCCGPSGLLAATVMAIALAAPALYYTSMILLQSAVVATYTTMKGIGTRLSPKRGEPDGSSEIPKAWHTTWPWEWCTERLTEEEYHASVLILQLPDAATILNANSLQQLLASPGIPRDVWTCPAVRAVIELRWTAYTRLVVLGLFAIRACYTVLFVAYVLASLSSDGGSTADAASCRQPVGWRLAALVALSVMTLEFAMLELRQVWAEGLRAWLRHSWTIFDTAQIILMALFLGLHWSCAVPVFVIRCLAAALVLVLFWRMLGYMTVMEGLGNFVRMVQEVTWDLRWFFVFLGFIFAGFGLSIVVLAVDLSSGQGDSDSGGGGPRHSLIVLVLVRLYTMMYSNFDPDILLDPDSGAASAVTIFSAVVCSIFMMFVSIILLNLLIAVIGDAYDRVSYDREVNRMKSKAALVVEVDLLLPSWFRKRCDQTFFHAPHGHVLMILQEERPTESADDGVTASVSAAPPAVRGIELSGTAEVAWVAESTGRLGVMKALVESGMVNTQNAVADMQIAVREQTAKLVALKEQLDKLQGLDMESRLGAMQAQISGLGTQLRSLDAVHTMQEQISRLCEQLEVGKTAPGAQKVTSGSDPAAPSVAAISSGLERVEPAAKEPSTGGGGMSARRRRQHLRDAQEERKST